MLLDAAVPRAVCRTSLPLTLAEPTNGYGHFGEEPTMEIKELGHLVLYVHDVRRSAAFYRDVLGWREIISTPEDAAVGVAAFSAPSGRTHHELLLIEVGEQAQPIPAGRRVGLYHFGLKVGDSDDELRDALRALDANGVRVVGASDHTVTHSLYILDPDGNEIELYIDVPGVDWRADPSLVAAPIRPLNL
jgi:catechol 2,3-dioxygenase